ncbi:hypothetical protein N7507_007997 [Penicillium longicatenatum]|nr:hypothetical protein N7507_007997 [Penicillium longicatenatum]
MDYGRDEDDKRPAANAVKETPNILGLSSNTSPSSSKGPSPADTNIPVEPPARPISPPKGAPISGKPRGSRQWAAPVAHDLHDSPAKKRWRQAAVRLPDEVVNNKPISGDNVPSNALMKSLAHPREREEILKRITQVTGVFMKRGMYRDRFLLIWGEPEQVQTAKTILLRLTERFNIEKPVDGQRSWRKIHPEYEQDIQKMLLVVAIKDELASLREKPGTANSEFEVSHVSIMRLLASVRVIRLTGFMGKRVYTWPSDGPTVQEELGIRLEKLDLIRTEFKAHLYLQEDSTDKICISGGSEADIEQIIIRLQALWKATMAKASTRIKAYIVESPPKDIVREAVILVKSGNLALPFLHGAQQHPLETQDHKKCENVNDIHKKNNQLLLSSFQKALSQANLFAGYLRMRVHFGSFVMDRFRGPSNGQKSYGLDEFREMVLLERSRGRLVPGLKISGEELLNRCMGAATVFEPVDTSYTLEELKSIIPTYSASFQFSGSANSFFRLEVDFRRRSTETEMGYHRWFNTHDKENGNVRRLPMQLGVMNFLQSDWQGDIELFEPPHNDQISEQLGSFLQSIRFDNKLREHGMATKSRKKVLFDQAVPVSSFVEKSAVQLTVKGTRYAFELARFDRYTPTSLGWTTTPVVAWGATLFNPGWDAALGASIKSLATDPKDTATHVVNFDSFFPESAASLDGSNEGFWEYMKIVRELSCLLGLNEEEFEEFSEDSLKQRMAGLMDVELGMLF